MDTKELEFLKYQKLQEQNLQFLREIAQLQNAIEMKREALHKEERRISLDLNDLHEIDCLMDEVCDKVERYTYDPEQVIELLSELKAYQAKIKRKGMKGQGVQSFINMKIDDFAEEILQFDELKKTQKEAEKRVEIARRKERIAAEKLTNAEIKLQKAKGLVRRYLRVKKWQGSSSTTCQDKKVTINWKIATDFKGDPRMRQQAYDYDHVFDRDSSQESVYSKVKPIVIDVMKGVDGCIFTFGQTGSGKSYTMHGPPNTFTASDRGLCQRIIEDIFYYKDLLEKEEWSVRILVTAQQLYLDKLYNLLNLGKNPQHCFEVQAEQQKDLHFLLHLALSRRTTDSTKMNMTSSRSHFIFGITVTCTRDSQHRVGHIAVIDMAGKQRQDTSSIKPKQSRSVDDSVLKKNSKQSNAINNSLFQLLLLISEAKCGVIKSRSAFAMMLRKFLVKGSIVLFFVTISPDPEQGRISNQTLQDADVLKGLQLPMIEKI